MTVAVSSVEKWVGATESGLLQTHEVALVPPFTARKFDAQNMQ
jgi:hypothetical protein